MRHLANDIKLLRATDYSGGGGGGGGGGLLADAGKIVHHLMKE